MGARTRWARIAGTLVGAVLIGAGFGGLPAVASDSGRPVIDGVEPPTGPLTGGHTVTVTGEGFVAGDTGVFVDGVYLTADVHSSTSLSFVAPAHEVGEVDLIVTVGDFESAAHLYRYVAPPVVIESPTATPTPSARDEDDQSVEPAPRPRPVPAEDRRGDPGPPGLDPGSRVPPELAATGGTSADLAIAGVDALLAGCLLVLLTRRRGATVRR